MTYAGSRPAAPSPATAGAEPEQDAQPDRNAQPLAPGDVLAARYRLLQLLPGHDPTARTWHALDEVLARPVAVRTVPAAEPRSVAFLAAAARAGALQTRLTTRVYDAAIETRQRGPSTAYVVSEWVAGPWLADAVADGPLPAGPAADLVAQAAESLTRVHEAGVVHGRLHPRNVVLEAGARLRLADTAVAAALLGGVADAADDVRALAAVLYALVTGCWPAGCTTQPAGGMAPAPTTARGTCAPRQVRAGVPRALDRVLVAALTGEAQDPHRGVPAPRTAPDLVAGLEWAAGQAGRPTRRALRRPFR